MTTVLERLQREFGIVRHSAWRVVSQDDIDRFADVTNDRQFIHIDVTRAAQTPFGGTIAHGFLVLSLLPAMMDETPRPEIPEQAMGINYGFDRLRFVRPVRSGASIRLISTLASAEQKTETRFQQSFDITVEVGGEPDPALVARWLIQFTL